VHSTLRQEKRGMSGYDASDPATQLGFGHPNWLSITGVRHLTM
jgi:hypothetical protein